MLAAVKDGGRALEYAAEELRGDREVVLAAVKQDSRVLRHDAEPLQTDPAIVMAAAAQNAVPKLLRETTRHLNCCKVIVAGDGRVGKTSMIKQFRGEDFQEEEISTCGLDSMLVDVHAVGETWEDAGDGDPSGKFAVAVVRSETESAPADTGTQGAITPEMSDEEYLRAVVAGREVGPLAQLRAWNRIRPHSLKQI